MQLRVLAPLAAALATASAQMNLTALLSSQSQLSSLDRLLSTYKNITTQLSNASNITLFAPNNNAINSLLGSGIGSISATEIDAILDYHVVPGMLYASNVSKTPSFEHTLLNSTMFTNVSNGQVVEVQYNDSSVILTSGLKQQAMVVKANLNFTGGVVHIIDSVLTIPDNVAQTALAANLTYFVGAAEDANLVQTLDTASDITVFAPLNSAFTSIGNLLGNLSTSQLKNVLEYHVVKGTVGYSTDLVNTTLSSLQGNKLNITVEDGAVFVNAARVVNANILISGGVMHVIDSVLNPNDTSAVPKPSATTAAVMFSSASSAVPSALASDAPAASTTVSALVATTASVGKGYPTTATSSKSKGAAAMPTAHVAGAMAMFGGAIMAAM